MRPILFGAPSRCGRLKLANFAGTAPKPTNEKSVAAGPTVEAADRVAVFGAGFLVVTIGFVDGVLRLVISTGHVALNIGLVGFHFPFAAIKVRLVTERTVLCRAVRRRWLQAIGVRQRWHHDGDDNGDRRNSHGSPLAIGREGASSRQDARNCVLSDGAYQVTGVKVMPRFVSSASRASRHIPQSANCLTPK